MATGQLNKLDENSSSHVELNQIPPSVNSSEPLLSSYLYSTTDRDNINEEEEKLKRQEWVMGIDEAGRGPVLGPMVYGAAFCTRRFSETNLTDLGFADSKTLTHKRREQLLDSIVHPPPDQALDQRVEWNVKVLTPASISQGMNRRTPYNLNAQAFDATCEIIQHAIDHQFNLEHIYVDTLGPPKTHQMKLEQAFPGIKFTVCSKADSIYPIVGAASVVAKVTRDAIISHWIHPEVSLSRKRKNSELNDDQLPLGSGYPADPNTVSWLDQNFDPVFGYGQIVRFSWGTIKSILADRGPAFSWNDEPPSVQRWFKPISQDQSDTTTFGFTKDLGLCTVGSLQ